MSCANTPPARWEVEVSPARLALDEPSSYTKTIRPAESITNREKAASVAAYGDTKPRSAYEYDHPISLELGGAANDARNRWPEPGAPPNPKDKVEDRLHAQVRRGVISLVRAQREIARRWVATYRTLFETA